MPWLGGGDDDEIWPDSFELEMERERFTFTILPVSFDFKARSGTGVVECDGCILEDVRRQR